MKNKPSPLHTGALYKLLNGSMGCLHKDSTMLIDTNPPVPFFPGTIFLVLGYVGRTSVVDRGFYKDQYYVLVKDRSGYMYVYNDEYGYLEKLT